MDYSSFSEPIDINKFKQYKKSDEVAKLWPFAKMTLGIPIVIGVAILVPFIFSLLSSGASFSLGPSLFVFSMIAPLALGVIIFYSYLDTQLKRLFRLNEFCVRNGLSMKVGIEGNGGYQGMIFQSGHSKKILELVQPKDGSFEIGSYTYKTGSGKNQQTHWKGFMALPLPRTLPHMVLDSRHNNSRIFGKDISNLPVSYKKDQTLELEGDFNNHFTLYAPKEYERDALYVFTPDLMALFIDEAGQFDAEVVDNKLFIYNTLKFNLLNSQTWERLLRIQDTVGKKIMSQTDRYADERVGDRGQDQVHISGKRLAKRGVGVLAIIFFVLYIVFFIFDILRQF